MKKNKQHIKNELKDLGAENLLKLKHSKEDIPSNYFDNLNESILEKVKDHQIPKKPFYRKLLIPMSIAACVLFLLSISIFKASDNNNTTWESISSIELESYINENIEDFTDEEFADLSDNDYSIINLKEEDLIDYLIESEMNDDELF